MADEEPTIDDGGWEHHPSYGWVQVNRVQVGPPGASLFDSELRHREVVMLRIGQAQRKRELQHDWIMGEGLPVIEVEMSLAQWGALVSSFGSSGVPATVSRLGPNSVAGAPHSPRLELSTSEVEGATARLIADLGAAVTALRQAHERKAGRKEVGELLRTVDIKLGNARSNARFAAESFTEHVENVVTKARADLEAMVAMAADHQLETGDIAIELAAGSGAGT